MAVILAIAFLNWSASLSWVFWVQLYCQNCLLLTPAKTMIRFIPMFIVGCLCNFFIAMLIARLPLVIFAVSGTLLTAFAGILFALIDPSATYWAFGFPSAVLVVFGCDFVYASGTIFIAKIALHHEQSVAGALFQTMTQLGTAFGVAISTIVFNTAALLAALFLWNMGIVGDEKIIRHTDSDQIKTVLPGSDDSKIPAISA
ncbi:uncharacterized protein EDB91DRAFT_1083748 [Suillus paluster]|uniref:uncharacterized protein n=1 Tax=Suillus paluster TaxID=48578 RepID=UPI001B85D600|nr:uncharacterized protein EDB91DRAFT_1083748 [Suillus paluster]KAG1735292.1 hypothetical protein EDB91DRAFT_1083748 [Suillus paluster]